ncbi:MAG: integrase core domain-containing protein [Bacillota bacterium]
MLRDCGITHERTGYNNPDANAFIERWFRTLKEEAVWLTEYRDFDEARQDIERYIRFYNTERLHSATRLSAHRLNTGPIWLNRLLPKEGGAEPVIHSEHPLDAILSQPGGGQGAA